VPLYQQSNTSAPAIDHGGRASRGPPLADDLGVPFDKLSLGQPTRTMTPLGGAEAERASMRYAQQEIYQSAREVDASNSLAAISQEVDATAADLADRRPSAGSINSGYAPQQSYDYSRQQHPPPQQPHGGWSGDGYAPEQGVYYPPEEAYYGGGAGSAPFNPTAHHGAFYGGAGGGAGYAQSQQGSYDAPQGSYYAPPGSAGAYDYGAQAGYPGFPPQQAQAGHPELMRAPSSGSHMSMGMGGGLQPGMAGLVRQHTHLSMASVVSGGSSAAVNARRKSKEAEAQRQTLPFNKAFVEEYRQRMKGDPDAEAQFAFAKYLIEAAKKVQDPKDGPKQARKYRDHLLGESLKLIKRLATTGMGLGKPPYSEAQFFLANCFGNGSLGLQVDHEKAYNLYVQASKQNHPAATYRTAVCNEVGAGTRRDHHRAVLFYRKASALGDTAGMYKLGMILLNGLLGQPRNVREAIVWLKRAAGQADEENPHALHELGLLHEKPGSSSVVLQDEAYARELFTQAAQLGYAPAQFKLGSAYEYGALTCPVDPRRSIAWYTKAAGKNDGESELALSGWYLTGSEGVLKQSDSEAYLWARRAATKGIPKAEYAVGYYSEVGIGVKADLEEAKRWYMRAAGECLRASDPALWNERLTPTILRQRKATSAPCSA
jgi:TPR repeat protein